MSQCEVKCQHVGLCGQKSNTLQVDALAVEGKTGIQDSK